MKVGSRLQWMFLKTPYVTKEQEKSKPSAAPVTGTCVKQLICIWRMPVKLQSHVTSWGPTLSDGWVDETWRSGSSDTIAALWCAVCPLPVLIILSLGVKEEWRWEGGGLWRWRLVGWPNIPRGQGTDGTWLPPHKSLPRKLRPAPVTVSKWRQLFTQTRGESRVEGMREK